MKTTVLLTILVLCSCSSIMHGAHRVVREKEVVLTFDDGPNGQGGSTQKLVETLGEHGVRAYFCLIGANAVAAPDLVRLVHDNGHIIVNHSCSDSHVLFSSSQAVLDDIARFDSLLSAILDTAYVTRWYRPPYGLYRRSLRAALNTAGIAILPAHFYAMDAEVGPGSEEQILKGLIKGVRRRGKAVVVMHDGKDWCKDLEREVLDHPKGKYDRSWVADLTGRLIDSLTSQGYRFTVLEQDRIP